jgi:predicted nucleotidyltransferase
MSQTPITIPERFRAAYRAVEQLEQYDRYQAAYIFGSVARGQATQHSDLDVHVVVDEDNACTNVNHPIIEGVKLDLSFRSMRQVREQTQQTIELRERPPWIADAIIVFDKTKELTQLQVQTRQAQPKSISPKEYQWIQFMFFHGDDKVRRNLEEDPITALFAMHVGLNDFLHYHYQLHQRWWLSSKRLLADLRQWDAPLAHLLEQFVTTADVHSKFAHWTAIIDHILEPLGGRQPIAENNCDCEVCQRDLALFIVT